MQIYPLILGELSTNCYIVGSSKKNAFIIDPADKAEDIRQFLAREGLMAQFIINTHGHIDHMRANANLGLPVYIHQDDVDMICDPKKNSMTAFFGSFEPVVPARLLKDGDLVELDDLSFKVIHTPGHTRGCICLFGHGVLFSGDTLFCQGVGRTDLPGSSYIKLKDSLVRLSKLSSETAVYPGHGPQTTIGDELPWE